MHFGSLGPAAVELDEYDPLWKNFSDLLLTPERNEISEGIVSKQRCAEKLSVMEAFDYSANYC